LTIFRWPLLAIDIEGVSPFYVAIVKSAPPLSTSFDHLKVITVQPLVKPPSLFAQADLVDNRCKTRIVSAHQTIATSAIRWPLPSLASGHKQPLLQNRCIAVYLCRYRIRIYERPEFQNTPDFSCNLLQASSLFCAKLRCLFCGFCPFYTLASLQNLLIGQVRVNVRLPTRQL
jgi:hypothetical protein